MWWIIGALCIYGLGFLVLFVKSICSARAMDKTEPTRPIHINELSMADRIRELEAKVEAIKGIALEVLAKYRESEVGNAWETCGDPELIIAEEIDKEVNDYKAKINAV